MPDLLRKALIVASKLKLSEMREWIENELTGYRVQDVPAYRKARASLWVKNPFHGLQPFFFEDSAVSDMLCNLEIRDPLPSLVGLLERRTPSMTDPIYPFTDEQALALMQCTDDMVPVRTISVSKLQNVLDAVRTALMQWAIRLEEAGIVGEGMSFTSEERNKAASQERIINNIGTVYGVAGSVDRSHLDQSFNVNIAPGNFDSLHSYLIGRGIDPRDLAELKTALESDQHVGDSKPFGTNVSAWIGKMVAKAASGAWQIGVATAGKLLSETIASYLGLPTKRSP